MDIVLIIAVTLALLVAITVWEASAASVKSHPEAVPLLPQSVTVPTAGVATLEPTARGARSLSR